VTERIRVNGEVFVAKTLAAVAASMSAGTFDQLCSKGFGPPQALLIRDKKRFYNLKVVKAWGKAKPWHKPEEQCLPRGRKAEHPLIKSDIHLFRDDVEEFRRRFPQEDMAPVVRKAFHEWLVKQ
jgi:hypothetical protein